MKSAEPSLSIVRKLYSLIAQAHIQLNQKNQAAKTCNDGLARFPDDVELLFQQALLHCEQRNWTAAEGCLMQALRPPQRAYFDMIDAGLRGYKARHQLAEVYREQNRLNEAETQLRLVVKERPDHTSAWRLLAELFLSSRRWTECENAIARLAALNSESTDPLAFRARLHFERKEFEAAKSVLADAIGRSPTELRFYVLLSHALLKEGKDWEKAEKTLRKILQIAPNHSEASQNLRVLLERQAQAKHAPQPQ